ncbi:phosphopantothenoylcysteine decarboxylase-like [Andrographis paniculata]|uniref:phosphopantothenoylcysteine decarboxylase-like n=1 Tax=Andrographis paniculata TaxID=175694 RepID=UPI0021E7A7A6|nr:phosphopantothenoylcysteine decarboxylase-like [Andrographis paniculata]
MENTEPSSIDPNLYALYSSARKPRILLAASGSVSATEFSTLCHCFFEWAEVKAVVTKDALKFIDILSLPRGVTVYTDEHEWACWQRIGDSVLHVELQRWADMMVIAPLSANTLGKIAGGLCDNLLTCIVRAWDYGKKQVFMAPSMTASMWKNIVTERHAMLVDELGVALIPPVLKRDPSTGEHVESSGSMADNSHISATRE